MRAKTEKNLLGKSRKLSEDESKQSDGYCAESTDSRSGRFFSRKHQEHSPVASGDCYIRLFHYSCCNDLSCLDPNYFGTSTVRSSEYKRGISHLVPRVYLYLENKPEPCVSFGASRCYEVLVPTTFSFYDLDKDPLNFHGDVKKECPYPAQYGNLVEHKIKNKGFDGYYSKEFNALISFVKIDLTVNERITNQTVLSFDEFLERDRVRHQPDSPDTSDNSIIHSYTAC